MAGLINWKKASIPSGNPDTFHKYVGIDNTDGILYTKDDTGFVTKFPTSHDVDTLLLLKADKTTTVTGSNGLMGGGSLSSNRTIEMPNVGTSGTYGAADSVSVITVDTKGRVFSLVSLAINILSSQVSNFSSTVLSTVLTGISFATGTPITSADTVLSALGKLQKQSTDLGTSKYDASNPSGYETPAQLDARDTANRARANHTGTQTSSTISDFSVSVNNIITALKGAISGLAPLGADSLIPSVYLPSYVDDILESANYASLPVVGETGKIYVVLAAGNGYPANMQYRWSGSAYQPIVSSPGTTDNVIEGVSNLYFTLARVRNTVLSGFSSTNSAVSLSDTVEGAVGKLQGQITATNTNLSTNYETTTQLNARDTANRSRANHTGTQLSSTISNFASTVLSTVLTGISFVTSTAVVDTDSVLVSIGKLQAQVTVLFNRNINNGYGITGGGNLTSDRTLAVALSATEAANATSFVTNSGTYVLVTGLTSTPAAGTYLVMSNINAQFDSNNRIGSIMLYVDNSPILSSKRDVNFFDQSRQGVLISQTLVVLNGSQAINTRVRVSGGQLTSVEKSMILVRTA